MHFMAKVIFCAKVISMLKWFSLTITYFETVAKRVILIMYVGTHETFRKWFHHKW